MTALEAHRDPSLDLPPTKSIAADTGSAESQITFFTSRIKQITQHLKANSKDYASQLGLIKLVGKRKKQLRYLKGESISRYKTICTKLSLRK